MYGLTRGTMTLIGVAVAGFLLWLATQFEAEGTGEFWTQMGLIAGAGLVMALSQLLGGWTKWGWPRISPTVFLLGFVPALVAGGLVLLAAQPDASAWGTGWAADLGLGGLAEDLTGVLPAIAFGLGLTFGFTFDTTGPRVDDDVEVVDRDRVHEDDRDREVVAERHTTTAGYPVDRTATNEPVTAERHELRRDDDATIVRDRDDELDRHRDPDLVHASDDDDDRPHRRRGLFRR